MVPRTPDTDIGAALAVAVVTASQSLLLLLDDAFEVVAVSETFCLAFGVDQVTVIGRPIFAMDDDAWDLPRLRSLLAAALTGRDGIGDYRMDLKRGDAPARRLALACQRMVYGEGAAVRLLLTVCDLTDSIAAEALKARLIQEKDVLLQEVQHRVANSLQIIASVLMQNARKMQSDESRMHLTDAHQRVMSVAAVQRQLAESRLGDVAVKPYLSQLCASLGASMIADHDQVSIVVDGDDSTTNSEVSVSLGLVVTELVINALKHAFPDERRGVIRVAYRTTEDGWSLSVSDDGVGMPAAGPAARAGLGTSIVNALATQLSAVVKMSDLKPGTGVVIAHTDAADAVGQPKGEDVQAV